MTSHIAHTSVPPVLQSDDQRRSHVQREQWESEWLLRQREAAEVIRHGQLEGAPDENTSKAAGRENAGSDERGFVQKRQGHGVNQGQLQSSSVELSTSVPVQRAVRAPNVYTALAAGRSVAQPGAAPAAAEPARVPSHTVPTAHHARSALWKEGEGVAVAMRLPDESKRERIVQQLESWLRDLGTRLTRVIINGRAEHTRAGAQNEQNGI